MPVSSSSLLFVALGSTIAVSAFAQSSSGDADSAVMVETVVAATRSAQPLSDVVADVSIVDRETLERSGAVAVEDVLARLPGVEIVRNGGPGSTASVYLRGANTEFTAVYIDGIRVDVQSGSGGAPWEAMSLDMVDRIEVMRGPAGAVYGSDAVGGVIQIMTKRGEGAATPVVGVGRGTYNTNNATAGVSGGSGGVDYSIGMSYTHSGGFNANTDQKRNQDADGYQRKSAHARLGLQLNDVHRVETTLLYNHSNAGYDAKSSKLDDRAINNLNAVGVNWHAQWTENYSSKVAVSDSYQRYETKPTPYLTQTKLRNYLWQNEWHQGIHRLSAVLERREDRLINDTITPTQRDRHQNGLALGWGLQSGVHTLQLSARHDRDSEFGGKTTGSAAYALALTPQWRATASAGTAFRVPTLYQRFSQYGESNLRPQQSHNAEIGLRWSQHDRQFSVTTYRNRISNLITYRSGSGACISSAGCYESVGKAVYEGVTFAGSFKWSAVRLSGSVDFQNPRDETTGKRLARRAPRHAFLEAATTWRKWDGGLQMQTSSYRFDDAANTKKLAGYTLWNIFASRSLGRDVTLLVRVDNLLDKKYQLADTYGTAGRTLYVGLKWMPQ